MTRLETALKQLKVELNAEGTINVTVGHEMVGL